MFKFTFFIGAIIAGMTILFATGTTTAFAAGMRVDPTWGSKDTTFSIDAEGFNKNERVATWVQLSNGTTLALDELNAGSDGSVSFSVTPDAAWSEGEVIAVAHGLSSGKEYSVKFNITGGSSNDSLDDSSDTSTTSGSYISNDSDRTITYYGSGYTAGERVATWFQYPSELATSAAHALSDVYADGSGNVSFEFTVGSDYPFGGYNIAAQGASSKHTTYNTFSYFGTITDQYTYWSNGSGSGTLTTANWYAQYWNNMDLSGDPVLTRYDGAINFDWGGNSPGTNVPADQFSARWDTTATVLDAGNYVFTATADDGIRVWVDGGLVIDRWAEHSAATYSATEYLGAGQHSVRVEYFENYGDAVAIVSIAQD